MTPVAQAIAGMSAELRAVIEPLVARVEALETQNGELLEAIAKIKPTVTIPPRPSAFRVEIDGGEKTMEISAIRPN
jgi:hypothetical protein